MKDNGAKTIKLDKVQGFIQTTADMMAHGLTVKKNGKGSFTSAAGIIQTGDWFKGDIVKLSI